MAPLAGEIFFMCLFIVNFHIAVVVAEVTQPSLGVGYEIGRAVAMKKNILCLFRPDSGKSKFTRVIYQYHMPLAVLSRHRLGNIRFQ